MKKVKIFSLSFLVLFLMLFSFIIFTPKVYANTGSVHPFDEFINSSEIAYPGYYLKVIILNEMHEEYTIEIIEEPSGEFVGMQYSLRDYHIGFEYGVYPRDVVGEEMYFNFEENYWQFEPYYRNSNDLPNWDYKPVFEGETAFVTNLDNPISLFEISRRIKLIDPEDGDVSENITIDLENVAVDPELGFGYWDENQNGIYDDGDLICYFKDDPENPDDFAYPTIPGNYFVKLKGSDYSDNYAYLTIMILVKDITEPVISGQSNYQQSYTKKLNIDTIKNGLTVTDNYDSDLQIVLESDNYSSNYNRLGSYNVVFSATDSSGNKGIFTININVIDDVAPVFTGPTSIMKGKSEILSVDDIKDQLTANDFIDGLVSITVKSDNYTGNGNKIGTYTIVFEAKDSAGNIGTHTVTVTVADNIPPVFYVDNYFITVEQSLTLTREDIIAILQASGQLNVQSSTNVQFLLNEYEGNESVVGIYAVSLKASSADGSGKIFNLAVQVVEDEEGTVVHPDDPWYKQVGSWFVKAWDWLKEPVKEDSWIRWGYIVGFGAVVLVLGLVRVGSGNSRRYRRRW